MAGHTFSQFFGKTDAAFRPLEAKDAPHLGRVYENAPYGEALAEKVGEWLEEQASGQRLTLVAWSEGEAAACGSLDMTGPDAWIQGVATRPDCRGRGLATHLVKLLIAEARRRGARRVCAHVRADNPAARRAYEKAGMANAGANGMRGEQLRYVAEPDP